MVGPCNSSKPTTSQVVGGVRNITTPAPDDGQACALQIDAAGNLLTRTVLTGKSFINPVKFTDVRTDSFGNLQVGFGGEAGDAFGRARVTNPVALFGAQFQYGTKPLLFQTSIVGTGSVVKTANESSLTLSTGGTVSGAQAINQTKQYFRYEPGKSQLILMTGILGTQKTNVRSRIGYFDANDGVFFEMDGTLGASVNQRSSTSGTPITTQILQANWNVDPMDGSGPSGITIDWSRGQIFIADLQWLGVGRVRFALDVDGIVVPVHQIQNANVTLLPYMNTANLPCRTEITNTGVAASTTTMKQICVSVISEGGVDDPSGYEFSASNGGTLVTGISTRQPLVSIRPKLTYNSITNRAKIELIDFDIFDNSSPAAFWELVYNGTLSGGAGTWTSVDSNSVVEYNVDRTACAGGTVVSSGYVAGGGKTNATIAEDISVPFTLDFAGTTADIFTLCVASMSTNIAAAGAFRWRETR